MKILHALHLLFPLATISLPAAEISPEQSAFFENKIRPLLSKHCNECHSTEADKVKGGLLLDSKAGWSAGGDSGEVIVPGKPEESLLIETVRYADPDLQMPPKYKLSDPEIQALEHWVRIGAPDPRTGEANVAKSGVDWEKGRRHWAFQPVADPQPPAVKDDSWARSGIDRFILAKIEEAGIAPAPDADRFTLIRRASLDLTGLPPTVEEVSAFVQDPAPDAEAFAKIVDRLLASERFGERWGRHWLDVARYADSVGRTRNVAFPFAWRYRNYVIDAFNADKPYDRFLAEQVAGDLLPAENAKQRDEQVIATGFLALGSMDLNERDNEQFNLDRIDDQVDTLGRSVLALTTGCARCHDHKFDPIAQTDYYALAGIFQSTQTLSGQANRGGGGKNYLNANLLSPLGTAKTSLPAEPAKNAGSPANAKEVAQLRKRVQAMQAELRKAGPKEKRQMQANLKKMRQKLAKLQKAGKNKRGGAKVDPNAAFAMSVRDGEAQNLALRVRGEPDMKGDVIPRGFPEILCVGEVPELPAEGSGRLELARWLTDPAHPLTARVMANRVWSHLFGRGIVPTVDNFGVMGEAPSHPELLDHLARRFAANGWSVKDLIREIMLSRVYQLSSGHVAANTAADEGNTLFWRMNLRRMEAEILRDSLLAAGGTLELRRPAGPPFGGNAVTDLSRAKGKNVGGGLAQPIRSVYLPVFRSKLPGMFTVFDFAEPDQVNGQRDVTTVAPQALFFLNNAFVIQMAQRAATRVLAAELPTLEAKIQHAYAYTLCRQPSEAELQRSRDYLADANKETWAAFLQALYSTAEFRYVQ